MWKNTIIMTILLFFISLLWALYYYRYTIYSSYIIQKVWSLDIIQEYTQWNYDEMDIVWESWWKEKMIIQLDWYSNNNRKQIAVQYYCKILCTIYSVWIYESNKRIVIDWENKNIDWIEDWWNKR